MEEREREVMSKEEAERSERRHEVGGGIWAVGLLSAILGAATGGTEALLAVGFLCFPVGLLWCVFGPPWGKGD